MVCASGDAEAHRQLYVAAPRKVRRGWIKVHRGVAARSTQRTGAQRMSYTLAAAAAACGLNKSTVLRAIKAGRLRLAISGSRELRPAVDILGHVGLRPVDSNGARQAAACPALVASFTSTKRPFFTS